MNFRRLLATFGFGGLLFACAPAVENRRPNILLIMADDLGYETLGCNGGTSYDTPRLDALASGGVRFTHAFATPLCTPSRVQIMTGKYSFRNYIGFGVMDPEERTFGHFLRAAGYRTAVVGKWQLYGNQRQRELAGRGGSLPEELGFDEYCLWQVQHRGSRYKNPLLVRHDRSAGEYTGEYGPDVFLRFIEDFLAENTGRPFLLYYPMVLTHAPFQPTPEDEEYDTVDPGEARSDERYFRNYVAYMDRTVGHIVETLERLQLRERTLLLFTGDNGTDRRITSWMGDREVRGNKGYTTAAGTHVPLIANWPGTIRPGGVSEGLIDFTDFVPTLLQAAGVDLPEEEFTDGMSFYPQLMGSQTPIRDWIFCDYNPRWGDFPARRYAQNRDWKLYDSGSFFHISEDPEEQHLVAEADLSADERRTRRDLQEVLGRMK